MKRTAFPFTAVIGQDAAKNALIWNIINPNIGGVLLSGQKGTAKSTLVRGLSGICGRKTVELPLNITEDRLIGSIDFECAVKTGRKTLDKGLLANADKNILYADEINLLSDNIVKALLETASSKVCRVQREGISASYGSDFILIGSMNPEESGLRPQLLDRFGLYVDIVGEKNELQRTEIVRRRIAYENNPAAFANEYFAAEKNLCERISAAREIMSKIDVTDSAVRLAAKLAREMNCEGHRAEIAIIETARAITAFAGLSSISSEAITEAAKYALPHRMRDGAAQSDNEKRDNENDQQDENNRQDENEENEESSKRDDSIENEDNNSSAQSEETPDSGEENADNSSDTDGNAEEKTDECGEQFETAKWLEDKFKLTVRRGSGRRSLVKSDTEQGRYVKSAMHGNKADIAFDATLRAAAPYQQSRDKNGMAVSIHNDDIRIKQREKRTGNFILFVVDASGSMGVGKRMTAVKGAVLSLLSDAYQKRDKVGMITFRRDSAELVLGMTRSVDLAAKKLESLSTGGKTPLSLGLEAAHNVILAARRKQKDILPVIVLVSDGRATFGHGKNPFEESVCAGKAIADDKIKMIVINAEQDFIKLRLAQRLAEQTGADFYEMSELRADTIAMAVSNAIAANKTKQVV